MLRSQQAAFHRGCTTGRFQQQCMRLPLKFSKASVICFLNLSYSNVGEMHFQVLYSPFAYWVSYSWGQVSNPRREFPSIFLFSSLAPELIFLLHLIVCIHFAVTDSIYTFWVCYPGFQPFQCLCHFWLWIFRRIKFSWVVIVFGPFCVTVYASVGVYLFWVFCLFVLSLLVGSHY